MKLVELAKQKKKSQKDVAFSLEIIRSKSHKIYSTVKDEMKLNKQARTHRQKTYNINTNKSLEPSPRLSKQRESEALKLSRNISEKIHRDNKLKIKFIVQQSQHRQRKDQLSKKIEEINRRNKLRLKQLQQFEQKFIKKLTFDFQKDHVLQRRLKSQYQEMQKKERKIKAKKIATDIIQKKQWREITQQRNKIDYMIHKIDRNKIKQIQQQSQMIIQAKDTKTNQKTTKAKVDKKKQSDVIQKKKDQNTKKELENNTKLKLLNIKLKNIDYVPQIVQKIARKSGDLSKVNREYKPLNNVEIEEQPAEVISEPMIPEIPKDDGQIGEYLKQIRENIKQLDELHR